MEDHVAQSPDHPCSRKEKTGIDQRKEEHLRVCLEEEVQFSFPDSGFDRFRLPHCAAPEISLSSVDTGIEWLGKRLSAPLLVSSMTGGTDSAACINRHLATAAQKAGVALALGSLRAGLECNAKLASYQVRDVAPDILLFANLGAVQLNYGYGLEECRRAVESVGADGLILHLNPLQEALQEGGNTDFSGLLTKISALCGQLPFPVIVKEVGWGISDRVSRQLAECGVSAIDVAGAGGTSWSRVEMRRACHEELRGMAKAFENWGIPTVQSIQEARRGAPHSFLIASGGVRTGVHIAKALALGADMAGLAYPLLQPATISSQATIERLSQLIQELRVAMFCCGCRTLDELRQLPMQALGAWE